MSAIDVSDKFVLVNSHNSAIFKLYRDEYFWNKVLNL